MMIAVLFEEWHTHRHACTVPHIWKKEGKSSLKQEAIYLSQVLKTPVFALLQCYTQTYSNVHVLSSSLISIFARDALLCDFILFKDPPWHHGECIGHLTHAPHVCEYISSIPISSRPLKRHVPHGAVWVGGLNIFEWISSLKCHLAFNTNLMLYFMLKCQFFTLMIYVSSAPSPWLLSVKRQQQLCQNIEVTFWNCWHA